MKSRKSLFILYLLFITTSILEENVTRTISKEYTVHKPKEQTPGLDDIFIILSKE